MTAKEKEHIELLYMEMYDFLISYAASSLESASLAEEAVQETFRIACLKPENLCASPNPKGWLVNTLRNVIRNTLRSRASANRLLMEYIALQGHTGTFSEDHPGLDLVYEDLAESDEFSLLKEMAVEGRSHLEMAQKRGITVNACKKRVQRAKEYLKKKLF